jgi:predicted nuclease of predicted toxin-antitoxin system
MSYAEAHGYIVLTSDLDFGAILALVRNAKPSVVQLRSASLSPEFVGLTVVEALHRLAEQLREGALVSIDAAGARVRLLPLHRTD